MTEIYDVITVKTGEFGIVLLPRRADFSVATSDGLELFTISICFPLGRRR